jgi:hypothetical protein
MERKNKKSCGFYALRCEKNGGTIVVNEEGRAKR